MPPPAKRDGGICLVTPPKKGKGLHPRARDDTLAASECPSAFFLGDVMKRQSLLVLAALFAAATLHAAWQPGRWGGFHTAGAAKC